MIYINGNPLNSTLFPDNTTQVWKVAALDIPETNYVHIKWEFSHEGEFMAIAQIKTLIDSYGFSSSLRIKYLLYARQDKEVSNETTFALHTFAKLLNSLKFDEIIIHDPHSPKAIELIENSRAVYPTKDILQLFEDTRANLICYPDKGALNKYVPIVPNLPFMYGDKVRNQTTGEIESYRLINSCKDMNVLIVDDICDGGATFIGLADLLIKNGAKEVNLFVSHGIFSRGLRPLFDAGIKRIFTPDGQIEEHQGRIVYKQI